MLEKTGKTEELAKLYNAFSLAEPATEEEFDDALAKVSAFLLFNTPWSNVELNKKVSFLGDIPLICRVHECPFATRCTVLKNTPKNQQAKLLNTSCREEKLYGLEQFSSLVKELGITPDQTTDIINVTSLVRLLIIKRRMDFYIAIDGMVQDEVSVVNQRTGVSYTKKSLHPVFKEYQSIEKQIHAVQSQLMASRKDRLTIASTVGKHADVLKDLFTGKITADEVLEGELTAVDEEDEE